MGRKKRENTAGVVYLITFPNGKKYVGITSTSFKERKASHLSHMNTSTLAVHQALKKFKGQEEWKVIGRADSWEELTALEIKMIEEHQSYIKRNGYNLTLGGDGTVGFEHSDKHKQRNSKAKTEYYANEENRKRTSEATLLAHRMNPAQAQEHSDFQKQRFTDPTERERVADGMRRFLSDEQNLRVHSIQRGAKPFLVHTVDGDFVGEWLTQHSCASELGLSVGHINHCLHGKRKSHKGYKFHYKKS